MNQTSSTGAVSGGVIAVLILGAGFVLIPTLASASPELINGFLILVLVGIILGNSDKWVPWLTNLSSIPRVIGGGGPTTQPVNQQSSGQTGIGGK